MKFDEPGRRLPTGVMLRFLTVLAEEAIDAPLTDTGQNAAAGNLRVWCACDMATKSKNIILR